MCVAPAEERAASDHRRRQVQEIREAVRHSIQRRKFVEVIDLNERLIGLIQRESLAPHLAEHYEVLSRLYLAALDLGGAKKFARLALADLEAYSGGISADNSIQELRTILTWSLSSTVNSL